MAINETNFKKAMTAALAGPEEKKLKISRHEFNVKPVKVTRSGNSITVEGNSDGHQISHHRRWADDDQIYYSFKKENGVISDLKVSFDLSKIWDILGEAAEYLAEAALEAAVEEAASGGRADSVFRSRMRDRALFNEAYEKTKELLDGSWKGEANFLIANIALRIK